MQRAIGGVFVFEIDEYVAPRCETSGRLRQFLANFRRVAIFPKAQIREIRRRDVWSDQFVALGATKGYARPPQQIVYIVVEPRFMAKLECGADVSLQACQETP